jgi:hypothetical protein
LDNSPLLLIAPLPAPLLLQPFLGSYLVVAQTATNVGTGEIPLAPSSVESAVGVTLGRTYRRRPVMWWQLWEVKAMFLLRV